MTLLGKQVRLARKRRKMSEAGLAARMGVARTTLQAVERGDPKVEVGIVLEAATLVGVPLFTPEGDDLAPDIDRVEEMLQLMPKRVRAKPVEVKDDF